MLCVVKPCAFWGQEWGCTCLRAALALLITESQSHWCGTRIAGSADTSLRAHPCQCKALLKAQLQVGRGAIPDRWGGAAVPALVDTSPDLQMSLSLTHSFSQSQPGKHTRKQKKTRHKAKHVKLVSVQRQAHEKGNSSECCLSAQPADQSLQTGPQMSTAGCSWRCSDSCIHWQVAVLKQGVKMPQLCVKGSSAKADTSESISKASSSQLERRDPRADARLCGDQGSSKINEGFGSSHQTVPRGDGQHMPGITLPVSQEKLGGLSPPKSSQLPPRPPSLLPNGMAPPEANGKRNTTTDSNPGPWLSGHRISLKGEPVAASLGKIEQNQEERSMERQKQNMRQERRNTESKTSWRSGYKVCWKQSHSEIISGFKSKPGWLQLVFCDILDSSGLKAKPDWRNPQGKSIKQSNIRCQIEKGKRGLY